jgi:hypothetical protein
MRVIAHVDMDAFYTQGVCLVCFLNTGCCAGVCVHHVWLSHALAVLCLLLLLQLRSGGTLNALLASLSWSFSTTR